VHEQAGEMGGSFPYVFHHFVLLCATVSLCHCATVSLYRSVLKEKIIPGRSRGTPGESAEAESGELSP